MAQQINVRPQMNELDNQFRRLSTEPNNVHPPIVPLARPNPHLPTAYPLTNAINSNVTSDGNLRFNRGITFHPMNFHLDSGKHAKVINILENEIRIAGESAAAINKAHNDARTHFEDEKIKHKTEAKSWSNYL